jgi:hypothetical protein
MQPKTRQEHHTCSLTDALNGANISSIFGSAIVSRVTCSLTFRCFFLLPHVLLKSTDVLCSSRLGIKNAGMLRLIYTPEQNTQEISFICQNTFHVATTWNNHIREYDSSNTVLLPSVLIEHILFPNHPSTCGTQAGTVHHEPRFLPHFVRTVTDHSC